jgi:hypothetical protein
LLSSHSTFLTFFGFGTIRSKSNEIGFFAPIIVLKEEAPIVNKDLLLPSCSFGERGNKIFVPTSIDLGLEEGLTQTKEKQCLNLKFVGGFNGAIRDDVQ